ncbi:unnamed protein product, partial [Ectocarpus sp. 4 AP-2014]
MVASVIGSSRVVRDLLRQGASVSVADSDGYSALHHSVYHKHLAVSNELIEGAAGFTANGMYGTPLYVASTKGVCQGIVVLIDTGANVDSELDNGATPLSFAPRDGWLEAVTTLLWANTNPLLSAHGSLPLETAVYNGHLEVVRELVQRIGIDGRTCDGGALV